QPGHLVLVRPRSLYIDVFDPPGEFHRTKAEHFFGSGDFRVFLVPSEYAIALDRCSSAARMASIVALITLLALVGWILIKLQVRYRSTVCIIGGALIVCCGACSSRNSYADPLRLHADGPIVMVVPYRERVSSELVLTNTGSRELVVEIGVPECGCLNFEERRIIIPAGVVHAVEFSASGSTVGTREIDVPLRYLGRSRALRVKVVTTERLEVVPKRPAVKLEDGLGLHVCSIQRVVRGRGNLRPMEVECDDPCFQVATLDEGWTRGEGEEVWKYSQVIAIEDVAGLPPGYYTPRIDVKSVGAGREELSIA